MAPRRYPRKGFGFVFLDYCASAGEIRVKDEAAERGAQEKVKIIRQYPQGELSISQASALGGVDFETAKERIRNYKAEGVSAFLPNKNKAYSPEIKRSAVELYLAGEESREVVRLAISSRLKMAILARR